MANGLGPRFNLNSCGGCHAQPAVGGTSPATNPQMAVATANGAHNTVPSFITANGPVREARFVSNPDGTPDGGVHDLFVITGRSDAPGCTIQQPDYTSALAANNVIFRIPTPTFGLGLVEAVPDSALQAAMAANAQQSGSLGISGVFNHSGNDGTITRFGWKAQNKSLLMFAGEAYNVEMGVTNELFPNEREGDPNCQFNPLPESATNLAPKTNRGNNTSQAAAFSQDIVDFAAFMRLSAPPTPASSTTPTASSSTTPSASSSTSPASSSTTQLASAATSTTSILSSAAGTPSSSSSGQSSSATTASVSQGQQDFVNIGCAACHIMNQTTGKSGITGASNVTFQPFSDFALHNMGTGLADGILQGSASGTQFRTAPLWGVGQRIFFLHDGRTNDLVQAINQHSSSGSEANAVIQNFNMLGQNDQQALINFLRSL
ncbi:MAG: thiol oxidoreductase [Gammaproteobacteria bacterium]|nr:thiol oxidoreductase [Gammaproteobacteria bacterium]